MMYSTPDDLSVGDWFMVLDRAVSVSNPDRGTLSSQFIPMTECDTSFQLQHMQLPLLFCTTSSGGPAVIDNRLVRFVKLRRDSVSFMLNASLEDTREECDD